MRVGKNSANCSRALRAHDERIETQLEKLAIISLPSAPKPEDQATEPPPKPEVASIIAVGDQNTQKVNYYLHHGNPGQAELSAPNFLTQDPKTIPGAIRLKESEVPLDHQPSQVITVKMTDDGQTKIRRLNVVRKSGLDSAGNLGQVDFTKTKKEAKAVLNEDKPAQVVDEDADSEAKEPKQSRMESLLARLNKKGQAIRMNLLSKSGLAQNHMDRDLNILKDSIKEATDNLTQDGLKELLDRHFGLDHLDKDERKKSADGCTIAALLLMNAAMLHQRIAKDNWLPGITSMSQLKNSTDVIGEVNDQWRDIMGHDFRPILKPAIDIIAAIKKNGRLIGLDRALHHIAAEAERIATTYADMGADHAGPLFNQVMGNQSSDGAFFTRPPAASIAARLTLDVCGDTDWTLESTWRDHKTVDLACGSGTLLTALLTEMKRRAIERGASDNQIAYLQKVAVEDTIKGLDINPVSLQLAAAQLTTGNQAIRYRRMGLHQMPYGPQANNPAQVKAGTLELLSQRSIFQAQGSLELPDDPVSSKAVWDQPDDVDIENAAEAARNARIIIMNPPFTERSKMGKKFAKETQNALHKRANDLQDKAIEADPGLMEFGKNSIRPLFTVVRQGHEQRTDGVLTMVIPTIALSNPSGRKERQFLAERNHIHTILSCHKPGNVNLSQHTGINESIVVAKRHSGPKPYTRFINLDRLPINNAEADDLHRCLNQCAEGLIPNGWGQISYWPPERVAIGDWTPAIWRSPELAEVAAKLTEDQSLKTIEESVLKAEQTGRILINDHKRAAKPLNYSFGVIDSKSANGQKYIRSVPDADWIYKKHADELPQPNQPTYQQTSKLLAKTGHLLITAGQNNSTGRLTAVADDKPYIGNSWMPIAQLNPKESKALAVYLNSTLGRLQLMRNQGKTLVFPIYRPAGVKNIAIPDVKDARVCQILANCWEQTKDMVVPQFRDGECEVRQLWDEAVATAMGRDPEELTRLRLLLHQEPHVRGLGYGQYSDDIEDDEPEQDDDEVEE